jgi:hypothetical protein
MFCAERESLRLARQSAIDNYRESISDLEVLAEASKAEAEFDLAHRRIQDARDACDVARAAMARHQAEHGC